MSDNEAFLPPYSRQAEEALLEGQRRQKNIFNSIPDIAWLKDKKGRYIAVNQTCSEIAGRKAEDWVGKTDLDIWPKELARKYIAEDRQVIKSGRRKRIEHQLQNSKGENIWVEVVKTPIYNENGQVIDISGIARDITERKGTEEELLFKTTLLEAQSETSIDGILVVDSEGKTLLFNKRFGKMWNIPKKILNTKDDEKMLKYALRQLKDHNQFLKKVKYLYAHKNEKSRDEIQFKDGRVFDRYSSPLLGENGTYYGRIWYFRDITEHKCTEQELQKAREHLEARVEQRTADFARANKELRNEVREREKAEKKLLTYQQQLRSLTSELSLAEERLRRRMATNVHDHIGQPLAISKIKLESLAGSADSPELSKSLNEICALIAQTIQSSRSLTFELSPPVLYELGFEAAVEWLVRQARQQHGLSIEFTDDSKAKPLDSNVRVLLFQAVRELLINVAKHARAQNVKISTRRVNDQIRISVKDDGIGFKIPKTDSHSYKTAGFGLFSIKERLGYIGGHLDIESMPGRGTTVTLAAPINPTNKQHKEKS